MSPHDLRVIARMLRRDHPLSRPVRIRQCDLRDEHGLCWLTDGGVYQIRLRAADPISVQFDSLIHEWAHALAHAAEGDRGWGHSSCWGQRYAALQRWFECLE